MIMLERHSESQFEAGQGQGGFSKSPHHYSLAQRTRLCSEGAISYLGGLGFLSPHEFADFWQKLTLPGRRAHSGGFGMATAHAR